MHERVWSGRLADTTAHPKQAWSLRQDGSHHKISSTTGRLHVVTYPAMLDVLRDLIRYVAGLLRAERKARGTRKGSRSLSRWVPAVFVIAWLRDTPNITRHGAAFGISQATAYRYLHEGIDVLADRAPKTSCTSTTAPTTLCCVLCEALVSAASRC